MKIGDKDIDLSSKEFLSTLTVMASMNQRRGVFLEEQLDTANRHLDGTKQVLESTRRELKAAKQKAKEVQHIKKEPTSPLSSEGEDTNDANYARWYWLVPRTDIDDFKFMMLPYQDKMSIPTCRVLPGFLLCREKWNADYIVFPMTPEDVEVARNEMKEEGLNWKRK